MIGFKEAKPENWAKTFQRGCLRKEIKNSGEAGERKREKEETMGGRCRERARKRKVGKKEEVTEDKGGGLGHGAQRREKAVGLKHEHGSVPGSSSRLDGS